MDMKSVKNILFLAALFITIPVSAQSNFMLNINSGNFGIGGNIPFNDDYKLEASITVLNIGIEHRETHLGIEITPYKYFDWSGTDELSENDKAGSSLANLSVYWNVVTNEFSGGSFYLGPFTAINYMFVDEAVQWNRCVFTTGAHLGLRANIGGINYNAISFQMGYHNIDGTSKYFIGVQVDALLAIVAVFYAAYIGAEVRNDKY